MTPIKYNVDNPFWVQIISGPLVGVRGQVVSMVCDDNQTVYVVATSAGKTAQNKCDCIVND